MHLGPFNANLILTADQFSGFSRVDFTENYNLLVIICKQKMQHVLWFQLLRREFVLMLFHFLYVEFPSGSGTLTLSAAVTDETIHRLTDIKICYSLQ